MQARARDGSGQRTKDERTSKQPLTACDVNRSVVSGRHGDPAERECWREGHSFDRSGCDDRLLKVLQTATRRTGITGPGMLTNVKSFEREARTPKPPMLYVWDA